MARWKRNFLIFLVCGVLYAGCNTQSIVQTEMFFRDDNPNLALTPKVCYLLGNAAYLTFRYHLAIEIIDRNLQNFPYAPGAVNAEYRRAVCYQKIGDYENAIKLFEDFLFAHPRDKRYESIRNRIVKLKIDASST